MINNSRNYFRIITSSFADFKQSYVIEIVKMVDLTADDTYLLLIDHTNNYIYGTLATDLMFKKPCDIYYCYHIFNYYFFTIHINDRSPQLLAISNLSKVNVSGLDLYDVNSGNYLIAYFDQLPNNIDNIIIDNPYIMKHHLKLNSQYQKFKTKFEAYALLNKLV